MDTHGDVTRVVEIVERVAVVVQHRNLSHVVVKFMDYGRMELDSVLWISLQMVVLIAIPSRKIK